MLNSFKKFTYINLRNRRFSLINTQYKCFVDSKSTDNFKGKETAEEKLFVSKEESK